MNFSLEFQYLTRKQYIKLGQFIKDNHLVEAEASLY
jgi:hypothetical protein